MVQKDRISGASREQKASNGVSRARQGARPRARPASTSRGATRARESRGSRVKTGRETCRAAVARGRAAIEWRWRWRPGRGGPIRGEGFRQWTDRMRDVEELLDNPEMRAEAARLRDRVRGEREEYKRHSKEPDWKKLKDLVAEPMNELRNSDRRGSSPSRVAGCPCADRSRSRSASVRRGRAALLRTIGERSMTLPSLIWGSPQWMAVTLALVGLATAALRVELHAGRGETIGQNRRRGLEGPGFHGAGDQLARAAAHRLEAAPGGQRVCDPGRQQPEFADSRRRVPRRPMVTGCAGCFGGNLPGRRGSVRITTFAAMCLTRTSAQWMDLKR